ncbi:MAG TPA: DUF4010 domain-containing protein [Dongiaceae bacterium]|nr:DUF4010 domain-containing protein [Dongiaceae bacterium]
MSDFGLGPDSLSTPLRLLVALAVGLLIGLEREWRQRAADDAFHAGLRTFGLIGLLGGLANVLSWSAGGWLLPAGLLALAVLLLADVRLGPGAVAGRDITTLVAALVTALLGALATSGEAQLAVAAAVVVTLLLNLKARLHRWVDALSETEIAGVLRLLVISLVVLPVLPNKGYGPYDALNPRAIWLFVVLVSMLSFVGYLAIKILGQRRGHLATGLFGGLVSSTATTAALARLGRRDAGAIYSLASGIALANAVMAVRMTVIVAAIDRELAKAAAWPLGWATAMALIMTLVLWRRGRQSTPTETPEIQNPFDLGPAFRFAAVLAVTLVLAKLLEDHYGQSGLQVLAAIAGLVDVDAITLTVARDTAQGGSIPPALAALLIAAFANSVFKGGLLVMNGGKLAVWGVAVLALMSLAGGIAWLIPPPWAF